MYLVAIAWIYVVLMMTVAEATSTQGTVMGALVTFLLYGALPLSIVLYVMGAPGRAKARRAAELRAMDAASGPQPAPDDEAAAKAVTHSPSDSPAITSGIEPDGGRLAAGDAVAPERKEP